MRPGIAIAVVFVGSAVLAAAGGLRAAQPMDSLAIREAATPKVCLVVAEGPLGLPVAWASGFLMGEGKFVVTDLASLAQPGVKRVTLRFQDGSTATAAQFGMADAALGLAVIRVDEPKAGAGGLALSGGPGGNGPGEVVVAGWKWGQDLDFALGRVASGPSAADLASRAKLAEAPKTAATFLTFESNRDDLASGAAVLDATGAVAGVLLQIVGVDKPVVVPAAALRSALLSADPQLKALAQLPKPVWPVSVLSLPGKPIAPSDFAQAMRAAKMRSRCAKCDGKGAVVVTKVVGSTTVAGMNRPIVRRENETCRPCNGEGVVCGEGLYDYFARMAAGAAWILSSPASDPKAKEAALANGLTLLESLSRVGTTYRSTFVQQARADLMKPDAPYPRGVVVFAQVRHTVAGPDGSYTLLAPHGTPTLLAVKSDRLSPPLGPDGKPAGTAPGPGTWVILGGLAEGVAVLDSHRPILVRVFGWTPGPDLGRGPRQPGGPAESPQPGMPRPPRRPGESDFFGL